MYREGAGEGDAEEKHRMLVGLHPPPSSAHLYHGGSSGADVSVVYVTLLPGCRAGGTTDTILLSLSLSPFLFRSLSLSPCPFRSFSSCARVYDCVNVDFFNFF